jgi:hypothetical protein
MGITDLKLRPVVFEHISALLSLAERYSMLLIERAVVGLLRLCLIVAEKVIFISHPVHCRHLPNW